jgi:hypothetical protein
MHQLEPPKGDKPNRVIVDILAAEHHLGKKNFVSLPDCPISGIRTSQYAVTPEKIVRLVFDMKSAPLYQVNAGAGWVEVFFTDKNAKAFTPWSSTKYIASVHPEQKAVKPAAPKSAPTPVSSAAKANKAAQDDHLASLSQPASTTPAPAPKPVVKVTPKTPTKAVPSSVKKAQQTTEPTPAVANSPIGPLLPPKAPVATKPVTVAKTSSAPDKEAPKTPAPTPKAPSVTTSESTTTVAKAPAPKAEPKAVAKAETKPAPSKVTVAPKPAPKPTSGNGQKALADKISGSSKPVAVAKEPAAPAKQVVTAPAPTPKKKAPAPTLATTKSTRATPTSRFRRSPNRPSKLKGTMVAEFPKRLVIKYKARKYRDPFETLINDSKTYDNPIERRIPNVEGLRLVGIIEASDGANQALFEDNDQYSYILKSGDKVRKGYVLRVEADKVYFQIFEYGWSRTVALQIEE